MLAGNCPTGVDMIVYTPPRAAKTIPVIDLAGSRVPWEIHKACRETGFFYVANHGIPQALIDAQFDCARRFFALPLEQKMALHMKNSPSTAGYEPIGGQILDSQDAAAEKAPPDLKESFYIAMELPDEHPSKRLALDFVQKYEKAYGAGNRNQFGAHAYDAWVVMEKVVPVALKAGKPGTQAFRTALRDATENMGLTVVSHGVLNYSKDNHWGFTTQTGVILKVVNGDWKVE